jgi:hypothetical protein
MISCHKKMTKLNAKIAIHCTNSTRMLHACHNDDTFELSRVRTTSAILGSLRLPYPRQSLLQRQTSKHVLSVWLCHLFARLNSAVRCTRRHTSFRQEKNLPYSTHRCTTMRRSSPDITFLSRFIFSEHALLNVTLSSNSTLLSCCTLLYCLAA